ncbi:hypothetical protein TYRP_019768 [Tyrophagus putrescentiae]|nr:hypothetical protein TYRP_019768 [Tyrophagus putrescentiae]
MSSWSRLAGPTGLTISRLKELSGTTISPPSLENFSSTARCSSILEANLAREPLEKAVFCWAALPKVRTTRASVVSSVSVETGLVPNLSGTY